MIQLYPPATDTTLGLLGRFCLGVPTSRGEFLVPCPSEEFARGALSVLQSLPPSVWETLAPAGEPPVPVAATPAGVEATIIPQTPPTPPEPVVEAPRPQSVISTAPVENKIDTSKLPETAPPTWEGFKNLSDAKAESLLSWWLTQGYTEGGLARLYGLSAGAVTSRRTQIRGRLLRAKEANARTDRPLAAPEIPKTPIAPSKTETPVLEAPEPSRPLGEPIYELGRRGMDFQSSCRALKLDPTKQNHLVWKEGQYDRAMEKGI